jgi:predicted glycoside hydrolase/deacetylase ChbG (UPF0249 family)
MSKGVNEGILLAYKIGAASDTSLLVNGPAFQDAVKIIKQNKIPVGLHVNLTSYSPISPVKKVKSLCKGNNFHRPDLTNWDFSFLDKANPKEIEREICAQFKLFKSKLGFLPSHLDSHKCEHGDPSVFRVIKNIAIKFNIPVRIPYWNFKPNYAAETELRRAGVVMPDNMAPIDFYEGLNIDLKTIDVFAKSLPDGVTEIIAMPGFVDEELLHVSEYQWQRARTLALMAEPQFKENLKKANVELIGYNNLKREFS